MILKKRKKKPRNKFEKTLNSQLKRSKLSYEYETERIPYVLARHYIPDFIIKTIRGKIYVEGKGRLRPDDRAKMAAVKRQHPNLDIRIVFCAYSKTNVRWAKKLGFKYAIKRIPKEWLNGL